MLLTLTAMSLVMLSWAALAVVFTGLGLLVSRGVGLRPATWSGLFRSFWIGWGAAIAFLQIYHLWRPVDGLAGGLILVGGLTGWVSSWRSLRQERREWFPGCLGFISLSVVMLVLVANQALHAPTNFDTGLYHLNAIRWTISYPIVPGLGNLHGRLAFNISYFLYPALLEATLWRGWATHVANSLLAAVVLVSALKGAFQVRQTTGAAQLGCLYRAFWLIPLLYEVYSRNIASPTPDLAVLLLGPVLSAEFLALVLHPRENLAERLPGLLTIIFLAVLGVTIKLSFLVLGAATAVLALWLWWRAGAPQVRTAMLWTCLGGGLVLLPWMARGVILSGYISYPVPWGAFPVPWRVPEAQVVQEYGWVKGYARSPEMHYRYLIGNWRWIGDWLQRHACNNYLVSPFVVILVAMITAWLYRGRRLAAHMNWRAGLFLLPPALSLGFWFLHAPDPRFIGAASWIAAGGVVVLVAQGVSPGRLPDRVLAVVLALYLILLGPRLAHRFHWLEGGPDQGFYSAPVAALETFASSPGLTLFIPREPGQSWDAPLPSTPFRRPGLRLRVPGDLGSGFLLDNPGPQVPE